MSSSGYNNISIEVIENLREEAINAANSLAFGDTRLTQVNSTRLDLAMRKIEDNNLYFTKLAVLEEMDNILTSVQEMDDARMSLAYKHYEFSNNSFSTLKI